ncbi:hypothetical protein MOUN0_M04918 [Monosporozyma unispora]|nr:hypothetical protein C6P44_002914 [Kazachstania unispora]
MVNNRNILVNWILCCIFLRTAWGSSKYEIDEFNLKYYNLTLDKELSLVNKNEDNVLLPFNITRVPGTKESLFIQSYIQKYYNNTMENDWDLEIDQFEASGYNFTNIVYTLNPDAKRFVVLSAHYDSKLEPKGFIGGMDSAAPCAILLYVSRFIDQVYSQDKLNIDGEMGVKIVFFDGEEAFKEWSDTDSLYGSRHLAKKWAQEGVIEQIETFVLLDLIGSEGNHTIPTYYRKGHKQYRLLNDIEDAFLQTVYGEQTKKHKELNKRERGFLSMNQLLIDDDHAPFWRQGVPVLHLIPNPFPPVWHTIDDDFHHLDQGNINKWAILMCEYLQTRMAFPNE